MFNLSKKPVHITKNSNGGWDVKREDSKKASSHAETQTEAIERGREIAQRSKTELTIHGKNGKIRDKRSYGNDPYPPKG